MKFEDLQGTRDVFVGTKRFALDQSGNQTFPEGNVDLQNVEAGDVIRISVWIKGENLHPDSVEAVGDQWTVALTPIFHETIGNNEGWGQIWASDIPLWFPDQTSFGWKKFYRDVEVVEGAKSLSVRLHPLGRFQGTVWMDQLEITKISGVTDVKDNEVPDKFALDQNYPNPFNPTTTIRYSLPEDANVTLKIYNMLGQEVRTLVNTQQNAGRYSVYWGGLNDNGGGVATGTYIYSIKAGDFVKAKKMILLK